MCTYPKTDETVSAHIILPLVRVLLLIVLVLLLLLVLTSDPKMNRMGKTTQSAEGKLLTLTGQLKFGTLLDSYMK